MKKIFERAEKLGYKTILMDIKYLDFLGITHNEYKSELFLLDEWFRDKYEIYITIEPFIKGELIFGSTVWYHDLTDDEIHDYDVTFDNWWDAYLDGINFSLLILEKKNE